MRSLRRGAEGRVAAGELLVGPFVAGGEVEEGQHQFSGVAVPLSLRTVPLLVRAVGGHDLRQRYAKHLGRNLCMRGKGKAGRCTVHITGLEPTMGVTLYMCPSCCIQQIPLYGSLVFRTKCLKPIAFILYICSNN